MSGISLLLLLLLAGLERSLTDYSGGMLVNCCIHLVFIQHTTSVESKRGIVEERHIPCIKNAKCM